MTVRAILIAACTIALFGAGAATALAGTSAPPSPGDGLRVASASRPLAGIEIERVQGQATGGFQVTPTRIAETVQPGSVVELRFTLVNQTGRTTRFQVDRVDVRAGRGEEYSEIVDAGTSGAGAGEWIEAPADVVELRNLEQATITVRLRVPSDASPGGHYGGLAIELADGGDGGEAVAVTTRIVAMVVAMVPGDVTYEAKLGEVRTEGPFAWREVHADVTVHNEGNIHTTPRLTVDFDGTGRDHEAPGDIPELLPGGERTVEVTWDDPPWLGRARATASIELEDGEVVERRGDAVWVATPIGAALAFAVALLAGFGVWFVRRQREYRRYLDQALAEDALGSGDDDQHA